MTPLHFVGDLFRDLLMGIPLPLVRVLFVALPLAVLIWLLRLPRAATVEKPDARWFSNLKTWGAIALILQALIYALV